MTRVFHAPMCNCVLPVDVLCCLTLESSGGTFINGQRIHQSILYPGDVISLAGVNLIFGQDLPNGRNPDRVKTSPAPAISADRPTAILQNPEELEKLKLRKK